MVMNNNTKLPLVATVIIGTTVASLFAVNYVVEKISKEPLRVAKYRPSTSSDDIIDEPNNRANKAPRAKNKRPKRNNVGRAVDDLSKRIGKSLKPTRATRKPAAPKPNNNTFRRVRAKPRSSLDTKRTRQPSSNRIPDEFDFKNFEFPPPRFPPDMPEEERELILKDMKEKQEMIRRGEIPRDLMPPPGFFRENLDNDFPDDSAFPPDYDGPPEDYFDDQLNDDGGYSGQNLDYGFEGNELGEGIPESLYEQIEDMKRRSSALYDSDEFDTEYYNEEDDYNPEEYDYEYDY
jgi:hypothetical protein